MTEKALSASVYPLLRKRTSSFVWIFDITLLLSSFYALIYFFYSQFELYTLLPQQDLWGWVGNLYMKEFSWSALWDGLLFQNNEHRHVTTNLILMLDIHFFEAQYVFRLVVQALVILGYGGSVYYLLSQTSETLQIPRYRRIALALIAALALMQIESQQYAWGISWYSLYLSVILASVSLWKLVFCEGHSRWDYGVFYLSLCIAVFSTGHGLLYPLLAIAITWMAQTSVTLRLNIIIMTALLYGIYFTGYTFFEHNQPREIDWLGVLITFTEIIGNCFQFLPVWVCRLIGSLGIIIGFIFAMLAVTGIFRKSLHSPIPLILVFLFGSQLLIAYARHSHGDFIAFSSRYTSASLLLWICLCVLLWSGSTTRKSFRFIRSTMASTILLLISTNMWVMSGDYYKWIKGEVDLRKSITPAVTTGTLDIVNISILHPRPGAFIQEKLTQFKNAGISVYSSDAYQWLGKPIDHLFEQESIEPKYKSAYYQLQPTLPYGEFFEDGVAIQLSLETARSNSLPKKLIIAGDTDRVTGYVELFHVDSSQKDRQIGYYRGNSRNQTGYDASFRLYAIENGTSVFLETMPKPYIQFFDENSAWAIDIPAPPNSLNHGKNPIKIDDTQPSIEYYFEDANNDDILYFLYHTGAESDAYRIELANALTGQTLIRVKPRATQDRWNWGYLIVPQSVESLIFKIIQLNEHTQAPLETYPPVLNGS